MCALEFIEPDGVVIVFMILLFGGYYYNAWVTVQKKVSVIVVYSAVWCI